MIPSAPISTLRVALRMANGFSLELLRLHRGERDFTDAVILATLVQSNSAPVAGHPDLQRRYAIFATPVPPELRRPISVNAVSASLGLPFETVRRRTKRLVNDGFCEATPQGMVLSPTWLASRDHALALEACYAAVHRLYERLARADCLRLMELPPFAAPPAAASERAPVRIVWRASADYLLRMVELLLPGFSSITGAFVLLEVARANTESLSDAVRGGEGVEVEHMVPDDYRTPVRASEVAAALGLPHETVRRTLATLVEEERCVRGPEGFIVPAEALARPRLGVALSSNFRNLARMFAELAETGVLALWDAERRAAGSVA